MITKLMVGTTPIENSTFSASFVTEWVPLQGRNGYYAELVWGGTPTGTITLEAASTSDGSGAVAIAGASDAMASSPASFNVVDSKYNYVRMRWTRTAGTMTGAYGRLTKGMP